IDTCIPSTSAPLFRAEEERPMARIPLVEVDELTPAQRDAYDNKPGGKLNLSRLLAHAVSIQPGIGLAVQGMMTGIDVPPLERQICVLAVLHLDRGAYEWAQHMEVSKAMGIAEERSEEHTSELQSLMRISYAVFCLKKKKKKNITNQHCEHTHETRKTE